MMKTNYKLMDISTGDIFEEEGWTLDYSKAKGASLVRAMYENKKLTVGDESLGLFKFGDWLPVNRLIKGSSAPVTYKSRGLGEYLGLSNLYITFSGYFPEIGAKMNTCAFKETEAYAVTSRMSDDTKEVLVVASAGNTARAFAKVCSDNDIPLLLCVPEDNLDALWFSSPIKDCVKLISTAKGSDYFDSINLGNTVVKSPKYIAEGGAKNIARRDGMGTTMLSATTHIGRIPDYYFQAVGSGTGAIAAWEANTRLIEDGSYGDTKMKLIVSQNYPFIPMYDAWMAKSRDLLPYDDDKARRDVEIIDAKVLSNRKPPYSIKGGLFDALVDCDGEVCHQTNEEGISAAKLFEEKEGIDIHPAAAIAVASLIEYAQSNKIEKDSVVMLNITGGGENRFKSDKDLVYLKPSHIFPYNFTEEEVLEVVNKLF